MNSSNLLWLKRRNKLEKNESHFLFGRFLRRCFLQIPIKETPLIPDGKEAFELVFVGV